MVTEAKFVERNLNKLKQENEDYVTITLGPKISPILIGIFDVFLP